MKFLKIGAKQLLFRTKPEHIEVLFSGVHSDIGGSYPESESGLSKITLEWMLGEASHCGLYFNKDRVDRYLYGKQNDGRTANYTPPDYKTNIHNSFVGKFKVSDLIPRKRVYFEENIMKSKLDWAYKPIRQFGELIKNGTKIHESVYKKVEDNDCNYKPVNVIGFLTEENKIKSKEIL